MSSPTPIAMSLPAPRFRWPNLEELALAALVATLTLDTLDLLGRTTHHTSDVTLAKLFTLAAIVLWAGHCLLVKDRRLFSVIGCNLTNYFIWAFIVVSALSNMNVAGYLPVAGAPGPWEVVVRRATLIVLFFTVIAIVQRRGTMNLVILAYLIGGLATCFAGLYEVYTGKLFLGETLGGRTTLIQATDSGRRIQGLEVDPDVQATFLLFGIALLPYVWHWASKAILKLGVLLLAAVYVANIIAVGSKAGWIGLAMTVPLYLALAKDPHKWRNAAIGTACGMAILGGLLWKGNIVSLKKLFGKIDPHVNSIRVGYIRMSWAMVKDHPVIGAGSGAFINEYQRYFRYASSMVPSRPHAPLNGYMLVWGENGTIGLITLLMVFGTALAETWIGWRSTVDPKLKMLGVSMIILFVLMLWVIAIYPILDSKYVWLSLGLMVAYANVARADTGHAPAVPVTAAGTRFAAGVSPA